MLHILHVGLPSKNEDKEAGTNAWLRQLQTMAWHDMTMQHAETVLIFLLHDCTAESSDKPCH